MKPLYYVQNYKGFAFASEIKALLHLIPWARLATNGCDWWIDHGVAPLVAALDQAMTLPPDRLRAMGERGRAWIWRDFAWDGVSVRMTAVYRWLACDGDRPAFVRMD